MVNCSAPKGGASKEVWQVNTFFLLTASYFCSDEHPLQRAVESDVTAYVA
ncbi:MAG: hypothetical protein JRI45_10970 [Deltaproteobacteria bacterium]|nr:hypothetical protein [Deltaproteobacteria bacterium]